MGGHSWFSSLASHGLSARCTVHWTAPGLELEDVSELEEASSIVGPDRFDLVVSHTVVFVMHFRRRVSVRRYQLEHVTNPNGSAWMIKTRVLPKS
jgi:hypothetical protein